MIIEILLGVSLALTIASLGALVWLWVLVKRAPLDPNDDPTGPQAPNR
jgi:hypothetical protein